MKTQKLIEQSLLWGVPFDYQETCGVILARLSADRVAMHSGPGWQIMPRGHWDYAYITPFPDMCPWTPEGPGWCIVPEVVCRSGRVVIHCLTTDVLAKALGEDVGDLKLAGANPQSLDDTRPVPPEPVFFTGLPCKDRIVVERGLNYGDRPTVRMVEPIPHVPRRRIRVR
jgi:hypothetical protein